MARPRAALRKLIGAGLAGKLMAAQVVVLTASIATAALVAAIVGPPLFHEHLIRSGHAPNSPELTHIEEAYRDASVTSLGIAFAVSLACAFLVAWYLSRRFQAPIGALTAAARDLAAGRYDQRVPTDGVSTELDQLAAAFNSMATQLERIEDTRRRLLSDLAHEMRTPIATLTAYTEGLQDGVAHWNDTTAGIIAAQTRRLTRLAEDLDDVSRAEEGRIPLEPEPVLVGDLLWSAADACRREFSDKGVNLVTHPTPVAGTLVEVDRQRFAQITSNVLQNALRHTPAGGTVTMTGHTTGHIVTITVADNGEGMNPEQLAHAFERFYRGDTARDHDHAGSGIGLTISRALAEAHGGTLTADSSGPGQGSTFTVTLPTLATTAQEHADR